MSRFIKFKADSDLFLSMLSSGHHKEIALLSLMAIRARRADDPVTGLKSGDCFLGDLKSIGMTEKQYRTAKKNLEKFGLATFKGANKGTVGTLTNSEVYDINAIEVGEQGANKGRTEGEQGATNKNVNKDKNEKNTTGLDLSALPEGISEQTAKDFIEHRKLLKKPLTQRALNGCMATAAKAPSHGLTPDQVIDEAIIKGWMKPEPEWVAKSIAKDGGNVTPIRKTVDGKPCEYNLQPSGSVLDSQGVVKGWVFGGVFCDNPEYRRQA